MPERIQKIMAHAGVASRRKCEALIEKGLVKVNGKSVKLGDKADSAKDKIEVDGKLIRKEKMVYIIINKPKGVLCSVGDWRGRKTVMDLVECKERIFPVGRLDMDSKGLMILTNDGYLANRMIHPRYNIKKKYLVDLNKPLMDEDIGQIKKGVEIDGKKVNVLGLKANGKRVQLTIHEGRKHIIKRLFEALDYKVVELRRVSIGKLKCNLEVGEYKFVSQDWLKRNIF